MKRLLFTQFHPQFRLFEEFAELNCSFSTISDHGVKLSRVDHKDWLSPKEVFKIFERLKDPELIFETFAKVSRRKDYKPNEFLYGMIIERLAKSRKHDYVEELLSRAKMEKCRLSDEFFRNLIKLYGHDLNCRERAVELLYEMSDFKSWPSVRTFNVVLNMLVNGRDFDKVHEVYLRAPKLGVKLDACCFNILIKGLCRCKNLDAAFSLLYEMPKQGYRPNTKTYSTLMHGLCELGKVDDALELLERTDKDGSRPDTVTFNILITGLCRQGRVQEGMQLLDKMKSKGCLPNSDSYIAVMYSLLKSKRFVEAKDFMSTMIRERASLSRLSYTLLIDGLCCDGLLEDACSVLMHMVQQGYVPRMGTWSKIMFKMSQARSGGLLPTGSISNLLQETI